MRSAYSDMERFQFFMAVSGITMLSIIGYYVGSFVFVNHDVGGMVGFFAPSAIITWLVTR